MMNHKTNEELTQEAEKIWNEIKDTDISIKERLAIPAQEMPTRNPKERLIKWMK